MASIDALAAALRTHWDRDTLAVYADQLLALGDPRGELIAIDLRVHASGLTAELATRHRELVTSWLGARRPPGAIRYGFLEIDATSADPVAQLQDAFASPGAAFIRTVTVVGAPAMLRESFALITAEPRPWLGRLTTRQWSEEPAPTLDGDDLRALATATPHLGILEIDGRRVMGSLHHGAIHKMRISGHDAIASLHDEGSVFPALVELDFAFHCHLAGSRKRPSPHVLAAMLHPARLPAVTHLDLSRNEPGTSDPVNLGGGIPIFSVLPHVEVLPQLTTLRLPSLGSEADVANLRSALLRMPHLEHLEIARVRSGAAALGRSLVHPSATIRVGS